MPIPKGAIDNTRDAAIMAGRSPGIFSKSLSSICEDCLKKNITVVGIFLFLVGVESGGDYDGAVTHVIQKGQRPAKNPGQSLPEQAFGCGLSVNINDSVFCQLCD